MSMTLYNMRASLTLLSALGFLGAANAEVLCEEFDASGVITPAGCTKVPDGQFEGAGLTGVVSMPEVTEIGHYAFKNNLLETVTMPKVEEMGAVAFINNNLQTVVMPNIKEIKDYAFEGNPFGQFYLSDSLASIAQYVFDSPQMIMIGSCSNPVLANYPNIPCVSVDDLLDFVLQTPDGRVKMKSAYAPHCSAR